ncbi:MAG: glycosyltransferase [Bacteroidales bacterium]|nr:glycosyltransferase [Bacteroidales bacterium]
MSQLVKNHPRRSSFGLPISEMSSTLSSPLPVVLDARVVTGSGGGPDKTILNSPRYLEPLGYRMLCGYLTPIDDPGYSEIINKAKRYSAPLITIPDRGPWDWRVITRLIALCKTENVSIWHGHDYKTNLLGLLIRQFHPMRLVTTVHGWVRHTSRTPLYYRIDRKCLPWYEQVYCVSDDLYEECLSLGVHPTRCMLLENGIDTTEYSRRMNPFHAKRAIKLSPSRFLIGGVGRLSPEKGFDILIRSAAQLYRNGFDINLIIVGDGDDRGRLESLAHEECIADRVIIAGWQSDVKPYFEAMDIFVLSSLREGLPNVVLEAMALGTPTIATRIAGIPRIIRDGFNGALIESGNIHQLTQAMHELICNHGLRAAYSNNGRETVQARFGFSRRMSRLARYYDELIANISSN